MKAEITINANGHGSIVLDGHDVASSVRGFHLSGEAGRPTYLELDLHAMQPTTVSGEVMVTVTPAVAELLQLMGWTPPGGRA